MLSSTVEPELGNASGGIVIYDTKRGVYSFEYPFSSPLSRLASHAPMRRFLMAR